MPALPASSPPVRGRRRRLDANPRFLPDLTDQEVGPWRAVRELVPAGHLAWRLRALLAKFDASEASARCSSLGRRGFRPEWLLGAWVYGALVGVHHSTQLARMLQTDAALRLMTHGHTVSEAVLRKFRMTNGALFADALQWTVELALERKWIDPDDLSVDSMRLQANASTKAVRTVVRSTKRLAELAATPTEGMAAAELEIHEAKRKKHSEALALCAQKGTASVVLTNAAAALMKFPNGAGLPGHRITLTAAGKQRRFALGVIVDADPTDAGKLESAVGEAVRVLRDAGMPEDRVVQIAADAGYSSSTDLAFAARARGWADVLVSLGSAKTEKSPNKEPFFGRQHFTIYEDGTASCPAGKKMNGPHPHHSERAIWLGEGCQECPLKEQCTSGKQRSLTASLDLERARAAMVERMARPGARERYNRRIATVEPVFSYLEGPMRFRRASCRLDESIKAEVLLNVLAYNLTRLLLRARLAVVFVVPWRS